MSVDYILNGRASGGVANKLLASGFDTGVLRPFIDEDGAHRFTTNQMIGGELKPVTNDIVEATATLRLREWIELDQAIIRAARPRLRAVADLRANGLQYSIPNGMGKTVLESQSMSEAGQADISMDGLRDGQNDRVTYNLSGLPLPIIHSDFSMSARELATSRNTGTPLDSTMAEQAGRRVAEMAEKLLLGTGPGYQYGGYNLYGYTNFPGRMTKVMTAPTSGGWVPKTTIEEVLAMRLQSQLEFHYGPWMLYNGPKWDAYLDDDYSDAKGDNTLRERLKQIDGIQDVRTLDFLVNSDYQMLLVQMTSDVVQEVIGMDITTIQWETHGGLAFNFKVMAIMVPRLRSDSNGNTGIVHGTGV